jgi:hypothetical protein
MVEIRRLIEPAEDFVATFPGLNFQNRRSFVTAGEEVLLVDPIYIADVYSSGDAVASYVRDNGLFFMDFGGDVDVPVWWKDPYLVMPISLHYKHLDAPSGASVLAESVVCDSGSFVFLPLSPDMPQDILDVVREALRVGDALSLPLPAGRWTAYYEQFDAPEANEVGLYRNIVLKSSPLEKAKAGSRNIQR